jgi:hypothetical protein
LGIRIQASTSNGEKLILETDESLFCSIGLARSQNSGKRSKNRLIYAIPLVALIVVGSVYLFAADPFGFSKPALDYTFQLSIAKSNGTALQYIFPTVPIGERGGIWATHVHDPLGVDGRYPVYMDFPPNPYPGYSVIHVRSRSNYTFVFGDFFAVWGMPLGQANTANFAARGNFTWQMCLISGTNPTPSFLWGQQPLSGGLKIALLFYDPNKGLGCA